MDEEIVEALDLEAVERCIAGDGRAFGRLVERHGPAIHGLCLRMVQNRAVAEELAQETFARAYSSLGTFRRDARLKSWLLRIAVNLCRDWLKAGQRRETGIPDEDEAGGSIHDPAPDPERRAAGRQELRALEAAIAKLPATYREAFLLKHVEDLSYEEIQNVVGGGIPMLKVRVFRAREMLRKLIAETESQA
jgi:RNA polymerase sigma-70 factor (ECF subfamily)